jgi:hypothetical protein
VLETLKNELAKVYGPYGQGQERLLKDPDRVAQEKIYYKFVVPSWSGKPQNNPSFLLFELLGYSASTLRTASIFVA